MAVPARAAEVPAAAAGREDSGQILILLRLPAPHVRVGSDYAGSYGDGIGRAARRRIAVALARRHGLTIVDDWPMPLLGVDCFVMAVPDGRSTATVSATLAGDARVAWSQPVNLFAAQSTAAARGTDPLFPAQPAALEWRLADLHHIADGRGVRVAIVDSQVDRAHPDLAGQVQVAMNFVAHRPEVPEQHGTEVAGIVAAIAGNGVGIAGIAPRARLLALRACWERARPGGATDTVCDSFSLAKAVYYAIENRAQIVNLSLAGPPDPLLARLLDVARARSIVVVAAFDGGLGDGGFPASHPGVVAVTDTPRAARSLVYSAPGRGIPTTQTGGRWSLVNGSSYAAAHVSGLFALLRGQRPARRTPLRLVATLSGGGAIDSCATLRRPGDRSVCPATGQQTAVRRD